MNRLKASFCLSSSTQHTWSPIGSFQSRHHLYHIYTKESNPFLLLTMIGRHILEYFFPKSMWKSWIKCKQISVGYTDSFSGTQDMGQGLS